MAEVLAKHQWYEATSDQEDPATGCTGCPEWFGSEDALDDGTFAAHQAIELANSGYGDVREARAGALEDAAAIAGRPENKWWAEGQNRAKWLRNLAAAERGEG